VTARTPQSMDDAEYKLWLALLAARASGGARRAAKQLLQSGRDHVRGLVEKLPDSELDQARSVAARLHADGVRVLLCDDVEYPDRLRRFAGAPPALFYKGRRELLDAPAIAVCGSRKASAQGLRAAAACGEDAAKSDVIVVSGYAKGVDTESHVAALRAGGGTVAVLAEGIDQFRVKEPYQALDAESRARLLVLSQFPPTQGWTVGAAMTRNQVVVGLGRALAVVEAGEKGGTLKAGEVALKGGRPVLVLATGAVASEGNERLVAAGARPITNRGELVEELRRLREASVQQLRLD
jgi:DNA processing protein